MPSRTSQAPKASVIGAGVLGCGAVGIEAAVTHLLEDALPQGFVALRILPVLGDQVPQGDQLPVEAGAAVGGTLWETITP